MSDQQKVERTRTRDAAELRRLYANGEIDEQEFESKIGEAIEAYGGDGERDYSEYLLEHENPPAAQLAVRLILAVSASFGLGWLLLTVF